MHRSLVYRTGHSGRPLSESSLASLGLLFIVHSHIPFNAQQGGLRLTSQASEVAISPYLLEPHVCRALPRVIHRHVGLLMRPASSHLTDGLACTVPQRYALEYLTRNWKGLRDFDEAFSGVDLDELREAVQPLLVAEGVGGAIFVVVA